MSKKLIGWKLHETIGIGIINTRLMHNTLKGWARLYRDILKYGHSVVIRETDDEGRFIIMTYKNGSSYCHHILSPGKQITQV